MTREVVVTAHCLQLCRPDLDGPCRLYKRFDSVQTIIAASGNMLRLPDVAAARDTVKSRVAPAQYSGQN